MLHFVAIFATPVAGWISRKNYGGLLQSGPALPGFSFLDALPEIVRFIVLVVIFYALTQWLYFDQPISGQPDEALASQ
jgi:hypothetical protein